MAKQKAAILADPTPIEEAPFLGEIRAHPADDAPRLVFADWLEERGDPRAEFIRVQCALASLRLADPARRPLELRERALFEEHGPAWVKRLPTLQHCSWGIHQPDLDWVNSPAERRVFVRGMPEAASSLGFTASRLHAPPEVDQLGIREWYIHHLYPGDTARLSASPRLNQFGGLVVGGICHHDLFASERLENIERLEFTTNLAWPLLSKNPALRRLRSLRYSSFPGQALAELAAWRQLPLVRDLHLGLERGDQPGMLELASSPALSGLDELSIANLADPEAASRLVSSRHLSQLASLSLTASGPGAGAVIQDCNLPQLTRLSLKGAALGDAGVHALLEAAWYPRLRALDLTGMGLRDAGVEALAEHSGSANLEWLELAWNARISSAGAAALAGSKHLQGLRYLGLWNQRGQSNLLPTDIKLLRATFGSRVRLNPSA